MEGFNLLPWRQNLKTKNRFFFMIYLIAICLILTLFAISMHQFLNYKILKLKLENKSLLADIKKLSSQFEYEHSFKRELNNIYLKQRFKSHLQEEKQQVIKSFEILSASMPAGLILKNIKYNKKRVLIMGFADEISKIYIFIDHIHKALYFYNIELKEIKSIKNNKYTKFFEISLKFLRN